MPAARASVTAATTSGTRCRRPRRRSSPSSSACAPSEIRVTPASRSAAASPRSSGPGLASIVTSAPGGQAEALAHAHEEARRWRRAAAASACRRRGTPSRAAGRARRTPSVRPAHPPAARSSASSASTNAADARSRPARRRARRYTTKSQYGQSETQNGTWTYSATGGRAPGVSRSPRVARPGGRIPRAVDPPALGRPASLLDVLDLAAPGRRLAGVAGREEDRERG